MTDSNTFEKDDPYLGAEKVKSFEIFRVNHGELDKDHVRCAFAL